MDIDYSFMSLASTLKMPTESTSENREGEAFGSTVTHLTTIERSNLHIKGFSNCEIEEVIKKLQERSVSISYGTVLRDLQQTSDSLKEDLWTEVKNALGRTAGVLSKSELLESLIERAKYHSEYVLRKATDDHYAGFWPQKKSIVSLVGKWPERYSSEVAAIIKMWPELTIYGDIKVDLSSTNSSFCRNSYYEGSDREVLSYPAFFKLIKDIWFKAFECGDTGCLNRVTHFMIVFIQVISDNDYDYKGSTREKRHASVIRDQFEWGLTAVSDIGALAFLLVTHPRMWTQKKEIVLQEMINRALESKVVQLAGYYCEWLESCAAHKDNEDNVAKDSQQIARKVASQTVFSVAGAMHHLEAIAAYIEEYSYKGLSNKKSRQISNGKYCDETTHQILHPVFPPDHTEGDVIERIVNGLNKVFTTPDYQYLFSGTPEYKNLQNRKKWQKVIASVRKSNWDRKNAVARKTIDAILEKARSVRVIEQRLRHMADQYLSIIAEQKKNRQSLVKQKFYQPGLVPQIDPDDQSVFYPASYYLLRKKACSNLKQYKHGVESVIGTMIPFCATRAQIDQVLNCFHQLPVEESRYWRMSCEYAKSTVIPELVQDLSLSEAVKNHQDAHERQQKLITCKCLTCTICNVDTYLCQCASGIGRKLSAKVSNYKSKALYNSVEKCVNEYIKSTFCQEVFDRHIPHEGKMQGQLTELPEESEVSIGRSNSLKRAFSEEYQGDACDDTMDYIDDVFVNDVEDGSTDGSECSYRSACSYGSLRSHNSECSDSSDWSQGSGQSHSSDYDTSRLNAHLSFGGELCRKRHVLRPHIMASRVTMKIVSRVQYKLRKNRSTVGGMWKAEGEGANAVRHLYQSVGMPKCVVNSQNVAKWFAGHPPCKKKAVELLEKYPKISHLVDKETLEYRPRSFRKIRCEVVYHDLDKFQNHLSKLGFNVKSPRLPLHKLDRGLYLHKTFCLCCRINFGQPAELKQHLKIHQEKMEAIFTQIENSPPPVREGSALFVPDSDNNARAELLSGLHQQDVNAQLEELFTDLAV